MSRRAINLAGVDALPPAPEPLVFETLLRISRTGTPAVVFGPPLLLDTDADGRTRRNREWRWRNDGPFVRVSGLRVRLAADVRWVEAPFPAACQVAVAPGEEFALPAGAFAIDVGARAVFTFGSGSA